VEPPNQQQTTIDTDPAFKFAIGKTKHQIKDDRTFLQAVLDFVNDETDLEPVRDSWRESLAMEIGLLPPYEQPASAWRRYEREVKKRISESVVDENVGSDQKRVRRVLIEAIEDLTGLKNRLQTYASISQGHLGIVRTPVLFQQDDALRVEWTLRVSDELGSTGTNLQKILSYAAALLITDEDHVRRDLCRCHLETCGKFFFTKKSKSGRGKPRTKYCCEAHMQTAHELDNARRQRLSKEKRRKAAQERRLRRRTK
jgi:hypothetical protein